MTRQYVDVRSLISTKDIANRFKVGMPAVSNWKKRYADFPAPIWRNFYDVRQIDRWYRKHVS